MGVLEDILIIIGIVVLIIVVIYQVLNKEADRLDKKGRYTYDELKEGVMEMINDYISADVSGMGLTKQSIKKQEKQRRSVARSVRTCNSGNTGSRVVVKDMIYNYLVNLGINRDNIEFTIPFDQPEDMTARQVFETMIYMNDKNEEEGFLRLHEKYNFIKAIEEPGGNVRYEVTEQDVRDMYLREWYMMDSKDKLKVLTQMLYADTLGLGVIDTLNYQKGCIEEIQVGMAGLQQGVYNYKNELIANEQDKKVLYSKDAIHILIHGINIWLSFLGFESESEMQRVLRNVSQASGAGELTNANPWISVEATDGRRVTVSRNPMSDSWNGLVRKFDTLMVTDLDTLYHEKPGSDVVNEVIRNLVRSGATIGFTGEMAAGKTSLFRAALMDTRPDLSIRVIESGSFELNVRRFLPVRNSMAMRVTESIKEEDVLALIRRTTGQIICVGEINSLAMANLTMNVAKFSSQTFFSAHYITTDDMVQDFVTAKICEGNFSNEKLAEMDAVKALGFDIHLKMVRGSRYVQYINEVVPEFDFDSGYATDKVTEDNASVKTVESIREVRRQLGKARTYSIRKILEFDETEGRYILHNKPSEQCYKKAFGYMTPEQYQGFCELFDKLEQEGIPDTVPTTALQEVSQEVKEEGDIDNADEWSKYL